MNLQNKLDDFYKLKADGALLEVGEDGQRKKSRTLPIFFRLEKCNAKNNTIPKLNIHGNITDVPRNSVK